jgi:hypothetical protein
VTFSSKRRALMGAGGLRWWQASMQSDALAVCVFSWSPWRRAFLDGITRPAGRCQPNVALERLVRTWSGLLSSSQEARTWELMLGAREALGSR